MIDKSVRVVFISLLIRIIVGSVAKIDSPGNNVTSTGSNGSALLVSNISTVVLTPKKSFQYFGIYFVPYVNHSGCSPDGYSVLDLKKMLKIILTKSQSIITAEMGYEGRKYLGYKGPRYENTTASKIPLAAAQLNAEADIPLISVSQGAWYSRNHTYQTDFEAALYTANYSNSLYPNTVWSVTFDFTDLLEVHHGQPSKDSDCFAKIMQHIQPYYRRVRAMNLLFGLYIYDCENILSGKDPRLTAADIKKLANHTNFVVCTIYPKQPLSVPEEYFHSVTSAFDVVKKGVSKIAPQLKLYLKTGWASQGWSGRNPPFMNAPDKTKQFWDLMEQWANDKKQRVFMYSAFDTFLRIGSHGDVSDYQDYFGYFQRIEDHNEDHYKVKATNQIVKLIV